MAISTALNQPMSNMNGEYPLTSTPHGDVSKFPKAYSEYGRNITSFDVYSPLISQLYSQVFWKGLPPVDLPKHIVQKFRNKGMAVVGFEMDQVRRVQQKDGTLKDVSVPLNVVYNHHFESTMIGSKAKFKQITFTGPNDPRLIELQSKMGGHGIEINQPHWIVEKEKDHKKEKNDLPSSVPFGGANGGEYRLSYHGYAPGLVQVIKSPTQFQITPMQIDTWHRDEMNLTGPTKFVPGPVPRSSLAPISGPDAIYSGLLECPLTTRIVKNIQTTYVTKNKDKKKNTSSCTTPISSLNECSSAASKVLGNGTRVLQVLDGDTNPNVPMGCSARSDTMDASTAHISYRSISSKALCGTGTTEILGTTKSLVNVSVHVSADLVTITLIGPSNVWWGVGFNASAMKDQPWAIIVEGGSNGTITERRLQDQNPGKQLNNTITVQSIRIKHSLKTVVATRKLNNGYFTFSTQMMELPFINAIGNTPLLSYHKEHAPSTLTLLPINNKNDVAGICICEGKILPFGQGQGTLTYVANKSQTVDVGTGTVSFVNKCPLQPRCDLLKQKNPTCDARTYVGGQTSCHHMWSLLDADQEIPWSDQPLEYHLKFRFWVQEYNASYHQILSRKTWGIASPVEYDVPKCEKGMIGCSRNPIDNSWMHTITGTYFGSGKLAAAHFHCHAPTCLSIAMYRCDQNVKMCNATNGELLCEERPIYGGTGKVPTKKFDEPGYILQPPCLWGDSKFGLEEPVDVDPTKYVLGSVKTSNATYGHHGEMAWQQMYVLQ